MKRIFSVFLSVFVFFTLATPAIAINPDIGDPPLPPADFGGLVVLAICETTMSPIEGVIFAISGNKMAIELATESDGSVALALQQGFYVVEDITIPDGYFREIINPEFESYETVVVSAGEIVEVVFHYTPMYDIGNPLPPLSDIPEHDGCLDCEAAFRIGYNYGHTQSNSETIGFSLAPPNGVNGSSVGVSTSLPSSEGMVSGTAYIGGTVWLGTQSVSVAEDYILVVSDSQIEHADGSITVSHSITKIHATTYGCVYSQTESTSITTGAGGAWTASSMSSGVSVAHVAECDCPD